MSETRRVIPSKIGGEAHAPPSKSVTQRAYALAALSRGKSLIYNPSRSADCEAALNIIGAFGAKITWKGETTLEIEGSHWKGKPFPLHVQCGESGLGIRMFAALAALMDGEVVLAAKGSLLRRPMPFFESVFPKFGASVKSENGLAPITVNGPLRGSSATVDGDQSSQYLTGLLIALTAAEGNSELKVLHLKSKPYIDLTLAMMRHFGLEASHTNYQDFFIAGQQKAEGSALSVDGDWSGAAFLFVAAAVAGDLAIHGLDNQFPQADEAILEALTKAGVQWTLEKGVYHVKKGALEAFEFDATDCPDLFPPLVALAVYAKGETRIRGAHRLVHKESNRAQTLKTVFEKMGHSVVIGDNELVVKPGTWKSASVSSYNDHRIAMAAAVAALGAIPVDIALPHAVDKSWPTFWKDLASLFL